MNCKPNDLAIVIGGAFPEFLGKIIKVTKINWVFPDCWETEPPLYSKKSIVAMADCHLKPIRPSDGEDEMLRIVGKPADLAVRQPLHAAPPPICQHNVKITCGTQSARRRRVLCGTSGSLPC